MGIKYRCLVLDHDDTAVMSTPDIHYPSFVQALRKLRPDEEPITLEEFITHCFNPGFAFLCDDILKMTREEQDYQYEVWYNNAKSIIPDFYPGIKELLVEFREAGGLITVVSHSDKENIERDYREKIGLVPDLIFGWEKEESRRKPSPYPLAEILRSFNLKEWEALVVDDLKPGLMMAKSCGVDFAAAGWSHQIEEIRDYMKANSDYYFGTVEELKSYLLDE